MQAGCSLWVSGVPCGTVRPHSGHLQVRKCSTKWSVASGGSSEEWVPPFLPPANMVGVLYSTYMTSLICSELTQVSWRGLDSPLAGLPEGMVECHSVDCVSQECCTPLLTAQCSQHDEKTRRKCTQWSGCWCSLLACDLGTAVHLASRHTAWRRVASRAECVFGWLPLQNKPPLPEFWEALSKFPTVNYALLSLAWPCSAHVGISGYLSVM